MADQKDYLVKREHLGDKVDENGGVKPKMSVEGDTRTMSTADAATLVSLGTLEDPDAEKADAPLDNKAEAAPANKSGTKA